MVEISGRQILNLRMFYLGDRPPAEEEFLDTIEADRWYPLEEFLPWYRDYTKRNPEAARWQMRAFAYIFRDELRERGVGGPGEALAALGDLYHATTRGERAGFGYRILEQESGHCLIEKDTWGDCYAALGTLEGTVKCFGGRRVRIRHVSCKRSGDVSCVYDVAWREPAAPLGPS